MRGARIAPVGFDRPLAPHVFGVRLATASLVVLLAAALVGPWQTQTRSWVGDQAARVLPHDYRDLTTIANVTTTPEQPLGDGYEGYYPSYAVDDWVNRAWLSPWRPLRPGPCEDADATATRLVIQFRTAVQLDRVAVRAGLHEGSPERLKQARPSLLCTKLGDTYQKFELRDTADRQEFTVSVQNVSVVEVWVADVYAPSDGAADVVAISELDFETDR